jgi:anti-anti-sigma factor
MSLSVRLTMVRQAVAVVAVEGELDISNAALLDAVLLPLPGQGIRHLIVAAGRLRSCDVCGFRVLASVNTIVSATGGALVIAEPTSALRRLAALMQLLPLSPSDPSIRVYATVAQALRAEISHPLSSLVSVGSSP